MCPTGGEMRPTRSYGRPLGRGEEPGRSEPPRRPGRAWPRCGSSQGNGRRPRLAHSSATAISFPRRRDSALTGTSRSARIFPSDDDVGLVGAQMPRKILVAVDGSETSLKAAEYASLLAGRLKARLTLLHVVLLPLAASGATLQIIRNDLWSRGEIILGRMSALATSRGGTVDGEMAETDRSVVQAIVDFAQPAEVPFLVLGTKGTSGIPKPTERSISGQGLRGDLRQGSAPQRSRPRTRLSAPPRPSKPFLDVSLRFERINQHLAYTKKP